MVVVSVSKQADPKAQAAFFSICKFLSYCLTYWDSVGSGFSCSTFDDFESGILVLRKLSPLFPSCKSFP